MSINFRLISGLISRMLFIEFFAFLLCVIVAIIYHDNILPFIYSALIILAVSLILRLIGRGNIVQKIFLRDSYLIVTTGWLLITLFGCLPYLLGGSIPSVIDAIFESASGFTTTGSSILSNIEVLPKSILFWRSLTHWIGGIGIILLVILVIPALNLNGKSLFSLESTFQNKIHPRVKTVGVRLLMIYLGLTALQTVLLRLGNMDWFDSICHSFGTVATGGFSPKNTSIENYSPYIQYVIIVFMVLAGTNFLIHYYLIRGNFKMIKENEEWKYYLKIILIATALIMAALLINSDISFEKAFRDSLFQVTSIVTCTGFATADYLKWPTFAWIIIFILMFVGGCIGSTSGGIKVLRHLTLLRSIRKIFRQLVEPNAVLNLRINGRIFNDNEHLSILTFVLFYMMVFVVGSLLLVLIGLDVKSSVGSVATTMGGIGPGLGTVGPASNFSQVPDAAKIILSILMIIGRLEIYTVLTIFHPSFWRT